MRSKHVSLQPCWGQLGPHCKFASLPPHSAMNSLHLLYHPVPRNWPSETGRSHVAALAPNHIHSVSNRSRFQWTSSEEHSCYLMSRILSEDLSLFLSCRNSRRGNTIFFQQKPNLKYNYHNRWNPKLCLSSFLAHVRSCAQLQGP